MRPNPKETAELVTFTEEILNGKLHFLRSALLCRGTVVKEKKQSIVNVSENYEQ